MTGEAVRMANHPNRNWRKRWKLLTVDRSQQPCLSGDHESGATFNAYTYGKRGSVDSILLMNIPEGASPDVVVRLAWEAATLAAEALPKS
jgi:hypothetical protein